jgi:Ca-activated chloride channel family protein
MPKKIPDLYAGEPLSLAMKINQPEGSLIIEGMLADTLWTSKVAIKPTGQKSGVAIHWAREMIKSWERATFHGFSEQVIKKEITDIALKFHLVSPHTSLVAVDVTPTRLDGAPLLTKPVSPNKPDGLKLNFAKTATGYVSALLFGLALMLISLITLRIGGKEDNSLRR